MLLSTSTNKIKLEIFLKKGLTLKNTKSMIFIKFI